MLQSNQLKQINASYSGEREGWGGGGYNDKTERQSRQESGNEKNERNEGEKMKRNPLFSVW